MPRSAHDDIIDLTDVIEEGHPERPNLQPSKSSASDSGDILDDLDLEREIDQIFADLGPRTAKDGQPPSKADAAEPDQLDLNDLFADHEAPKSALPKENAKASEKITEEDFAGFQDDFEDLFAQEPARDQDLQAESDQEVHLSSDPNVIGTESAASSHIIPDDLFPDTSEETVPMPPESSTDLVAEAMGDETADEQLDQMPEETAFESDQHVESDQKTDASSKTNDDVPAPTSLHEHADFDAALAVDPSMTETILRRLDELESKLAIQEQVEPVQPDMNALLEQVNGQIDSRVDASLQDVREAGSRTLVEMELLRQADQAAESRLSQEMNRLEELAEQLKAEQEQRLEQVTAVLRDEMTKMIEDTTNELKNYMVGHVETQFSQFNDRLEALQDRIQGSEEQAGDSGSDHLEEQEHHILETIRSEIQDLRTEWEGQRSTLAGDLENSLNYWTRLQEKFNTMQEEWSVLREAQERRASDQHPDGESPEAMESKIEQLRNELRNELLDEIHKAVPGAAAQIIREEIQALSQEES